MRFTTATVAIAALLSAASTSIVADDSSASVRAIRRRVNSSKALKLNAQAKDVFQNSAVAEAEGKDEVAVEEEITKYGVPTNLTPRSRRVICWCEGKLPLDKEFGFHCRSTHRRT